MRVLTRVFSFQDGAESPSPLGDVFESPRKRERLCELEPLNKKKNVLKSACMFQRCVCVLVFMWKCVLEDKAKH